MRQLDEHDFKNMEGGLVIMELGQIILRELPDVQTITWANKAREWLKSWKPIAGNGYHRYSVELGKESIALENWITEFSMQMERALGPWLPKDRNPLGDFEFIWCEEPARPNQPFHINSHTTSSNNCERIVKNIEEERGNKQ